MKRILEFTSPDDDYDFRTAINAHNYRRALEEIYQDWRNHDKHDAPAPTREIFIRILEENNVRLFDDE